MTMKGGLLKASVVVVLLAGTVYVSQASADTVIGGIPVRVGDDSATQHLGTMTVAKGQGQHSPIVEHRQDATPARETKDVIASWFREHLYGTPRK